MNYLRGWLSRFKTRRRISSHRIHGESGGMDTAAVASTREHLVGFFALYSQDDIYNLNVTGFVYKLSPPSALSSEPVAGSKCSKERITVGLLCNTSGTQEEAYCRAEGGATVFWKDVWPKLIFLL